MVHKKAVYYLAVMQVFLASSAKAQELLEPATIVAGQRLCVLGDRVVPLAERECLRLQHDEQRPSHIVSEVLDRLALDIATPVLRLSLLEGVALGARYRMQIEPSYRERFFTRVDRYTLDADVRPGDWLPGLPLSIAIDAGGEIVFAQQFASGAEARNPENAYLPDRLPVTTVRALALKPGDYVRFDAHLNLLARFGQLLALPQRLLSTKSSVSALAVGKFEVHVFRLGDERLRIKLVAERSRTANATTSLSPDIPLALLGVNNATQRLVELTKFDRSLSLAAEKAGQSVFVVDYTLDLTKADVRAAYDQIFNAKLSLGARAVASVTGTHQNLRHALVGSVIELDSLTAEGGSNEGSPSVVRNFKGSAYANSRHLDFRLALRSYQVERQRIFREKLLTRIRRSDGVDIPEYYLLPSWTRTRQRSALFGNLQEASMQTADAIFSANSVGQPQAFQNLGFRFLYEDSILRPTEYNRLREKIELLLPDKGEQALLERLENTAWLSEKSHRQVRLSLNYFFREEALRGLEAQGFGTNRRLQTEIVEFVLDSLENSELLYFDGDLTDFVARYRSKVAPRRHERRDPRAHARRIAQVLWGKEIREVAGKLTRALTTSVPNEDRLNAFKSLRLSTFYRAIGSGLWIHLINQADLDLESVLYIEMTLDGQDRESVHFQFGDDSERELYQAVQLIDSVLNDRNRDMRETGQLDSIVSRMAIASAPQ